MKISVIVSRMFTFFGILGIQTIATAQVELGPRPPTGIYDDANVFTDAQESVLADKLRASLLAHHLEVYVATYRIVKGETIAERAARLRSAWTRNPFGMVVVFDESVSQMTFVGSKDLEKFVSSQQLRTAFQRAGLRARHYLDEKAKANEKPKNDVLLTKAIESLLQDPVLTERMTQPEPFRFTGTMVKLLLILVGLATVAGVVVMFGEERFAKARTLNQRISYFPRTHMPIRLGAIYSGGVNATLEVQPVKASPS